MALIVVTGVPRSGKTTLCNGYQGHPGLKAILDNATYYDKDKIGDMFMAQLESAPDKRFGEIYYSGIRAITYKVMEQYARRDSKGDIPTQEDLTTIVNTLLQDEELKKLYQPLIPEIHANLISMTGRKNGRVDNVIIDGTYASEVYDPQTAQVVKQRWEEIAALGNHPLVHLRCRAPEEVIMERIIAGNRAEDQWKIGDPGYFFHKEPIEAHNNTRPSYIDDNQTFWKVIHQALSHVLESERYHTHERGYIQ